MDSVQYPIHALGPGDTIGSFTFSPNTAADPSSTYWSGSLRQYVSTVGYTATGVYTITFTSRFRFNASIFLATAQIENLTNYFQVVQSGAYNATTRALVLQAHRAGTAYEVPASTGAGKIALVVYGKNSTGK